MKLPSTYLPPSPNNLDFVHNLVNERVLAHNPVHIKCNMTNAQYTALYKLADREDIIIEKADKGSNIVIQNRKDYIT